MQLTSSDRHCDEKAADVVSDTLHGKGWGRTPPPATVVLLGRCDGRLEPTELLDQQLRQNKNSPEGLASLA